MRGCFIQNFLHNEGGAFCSTVCWSSMATLLRTTGVTPAGLIISKLLWGLYCNFKSHGYFNADLRTDLLQNSRCSKNACLFKLGLTSLIPPAIFSPVCNFRDLPRLNRRCRNLPLRHSNSRRISVSQKEVSCESKSRTAHVSQYRCRSPWQENGWYGPKWGTNSNTHEPKKIRQSLDQSGTNLAQCTGG